ncbi:MAG: nitronate monooxygenase family protein [Coriobacteriia bacterium]|nr:nitronate monooxygenase family protein [Coriobacteriia bacterium]MDR2715011.1 nitronate monooxygenase family protein [Coriobacteriales bacterium]
MLLNSFLKTSYPFMQGGMAQIATGRFAAAVSNAGALGIIAAGGKTAEQLRAEIHTLRSLSDKPFGVNIMLMAPDIENIAAVVAEEQVPVITTGAGSPTAFIEQWKNAGSKVIPVIPSVALALRMEKYGADAVVAEGTESGGHVGELTTMALVPQVVDAVDIPVIAAGGIASGRQLCAAFAFGAIGAQMGTALLVSEECPIHENYKQMLLAAKDTATTVTGRAKGAPVRIIKNKMARTYLKLEQETTDRAAFEELTLGSLRKAVFDGDEDGGSFMAGQVAGQLKEIEPLSAIFARLMEQYEQTREGLPVL